MAVPEAGGRRASSRGLMQIALLLAGVLLVWWSATPQVSHAQVDTYQFETDAQAERFRRLSNEFRCPMCQNTSLTGSTGGVAEDLRREIYRMIVAGRTDAEIEQFMFERYGDFIFYRPRLRADTVLLWFGPVVFLLLGVWVIRGIVRRSRAATPTAGAPLDPDEQRRLDELLKQEP